MHRSYPVRRKGKAQSSPVTSIRFGPAAHEKLNTIHTMLAKRWRLTDKPSLSLLLEGVISLWADEMQHDPSAVTDLLNEIKARGGTRGRRNQFVLDGQQFKNESLTRTLKETEQVNA
ncbi:MAG: hypothetical protein KF693_05145 [Nitrospira sp.]|nr:hypothetical protein [Nitrospira sp.]